MTLRTARAVPNDIPQLLALYNLVYGQTYPLAVGTDPVIMKTVITNPHHLWMVVHDDDEKKIIGSLLAEQDPENRIGRLQALVIHPDYRRLNLASRLAEEIVNEALGPQGFVNSLYTTTRTLSIGPQAIFLNLGFLPLGVFPNCHRVKDYETLTLMARFREGVLARRPPLPPLPEKLLPIIGVVNSVMGVIPQTPIEIDQRSKPAAKYGPQEFELIYAANFVKRRFLQNFPDPYDRFYPFHEPNLLITAKEGGAEIYAYLGKQDGYCTLVGGTDPFWTLASSFEGLLKDLMEFGASYFEILLSLNHTDSLNALLDHQFLPSAFYPAMLEVDGQLQDLVVLSRTAEPLNFKGMAVDRRFKPYIDQYIRLWSQMNFEGMEVIDE